MLRAPLVLIIMMTMTMMIMTIMMTMTIMMMMMMTIMTTTGHNGRRSSAGSGGSAGSCTCYQVPTHHHPHYHHLNYHHPHYHHLNYLNNHHHYQCHAAGTSMGASHHDPRKLSRESLQGSLLHDINSNLVAPGGTITYSTQIIYWKNFHLSP